MTTDPRPLLFGASYYHEYMPTPRLDVDMQLMSDANFNVIRVGESVWSKWEPRQGDFNLEWLGPILDAAHAHGISVIIGTPSYAVPPWLRKGYPATTAERSPGHPIPYGHRQDVDFTNPQYLRLVKRLVTRIVTRYRDHPAVIGWQVDNEPGIEILHNSGVREAFATYLQSRYHGVQDLNQQWGLTYWAHELSKWDELWSAEGNTVPSFDIEWRRFQASLTTTFITWQLALVRALCRPDHFITTCIDRNRPAVDLRDLAHQLDVTAINIYYDTPLRGPTNGKDEGVERPRSVSAERGTPAGLRFASDIARGARQERFMVTETNASSTFGISESEPLYAGQLRQAAWAMIARGADMIEYWHWHTNHYGNETYWGGVLGHSLEPGRTYQEVKAIGAEMKQVAHDLREFRPDSSVAFLTSKDSEWAMQFQPPLLDSDGSPDRNSYWRFVRPFYDGFVAAGCQADVFDARDFAGVPADLVKRWPVVVAAGLYISDDALLATLHEYVLAGGHLVLGPRSGYADSLARPRTAIMPGVLRQHAGVRYTEYNTLRSPLTVQSNALDGGAHIADYWVDCLEAEGATVLAGYDHPHFSRFAAITNCTSGRGEVTTVGALPGDSLAASLARWVRNRSLTAASNWEHLPPQVTVTSGVNEVAERVWFLHNWSWDVIEVTVPFESRLLFDGHAVLSNTKIYLEPWGVALLKQSATGSRAQRSISRWTPREERQ